MRDPEYTETADDEIMVIPQIETELSVRNVEEIVTTDGIDAVFVGPFDLSLSLGVFRQFESSTFQRAIKMIVSSCEAHGIAPGLLAPTGSPQRSVEQGFKLISLGLDLTMLTQQIRDVMKTVR